MNQWKSKTRLWAGGVALGVVLPMSSFATTLAPNFTLEGRLLNAAGTAAATDTVDFTVGVYSPAGTCLLYEQKNLNVDLSQTDGFYRLTIGSNTGSASRTSSDPGKTIAAIFSNSSQIRTDDSATTQTCPGGYTPAAGDQRLVRITVTSHSTGIPETLSPDLSISPIPHATVAESVQGLTPELLLQITGNASPYVFNASDLDKIFGPSGPGATAAADASTMHHHDSLYAKLSGSSSISMGAGSYLGLGSRASDPSGLGAGDAGKTWYDSTAKAVKYWDGSAIQTLGTSAGGGVASVTSAGAPITIGGTASAPTVGISQASSVSDGFLSSSDWLSFNNKVSSQWTTSGSNIHYSAGNVGVGTASPGSKLDVVGDARVGSGTGTSLVTVNASGADSARGKFKIWGGGFGNPSWDMGTDSAKDVFEIGYIYSGSRTSTFAITQAGNVGIGTKAPAIMTGSSFSSANRILEISGDGSASNFANGALLLSNDRATAATNDVLGVVYFGHKDSSMTNGRVFSTILSRLVGSGGAGGFGSVLTFATRPDNSGGGASERMRIDDVGNVGIGTTAPSTKLEVAGSIISTPTAIASGVAVDLATSNTFTLASVGGSAGSAITIALSNPAHGGTYTLVITDTVSHTYDFSGCTAKYWKPASVPTTDGTRSIFTLTTINTGGTDYDCYISWATGYQ